MKNISSRLRRNMLSGSAASLINIALIAITYPVYLHYIGYEAYGLWLVLSTVLTFSRLSDLGVSAAVAKLVAEDYGHNNNLGIRQTITTALLTLLVSGSLAVLLITSFSSPIIDSFKLTTHQTLLTQQLLPYIALLCLYGILAEVFLNALTGLGRIDLTNGIQTLGRAAGASITILLLASGHSIESFLIGTFASQSIWILGSLLAIPKTISFHLLRRENLQIHSLQCILRFGKNLFAGSLIGLFMYPFSTWMLSRYAGVSAIPIYDMAYRGAMQIRGMIEMGFRALMPEASQLAQKKSPDTIVSLNRAALTFLVRYGIPLYLIILFASFPLLKLWLGARFDPTIPPTFQIALAATFISLLGVPTYYISMGLGHAHICFRERLINSTGNMLAVTTTALITGSLSPQKMAICLVFSFGLSLFYLLFFSPCVHNGLKNLRPRW